MTTAAAGLRLEPMTPADLPAVLEIEAVSFSNPWRESDFRFALEADTGYARVCRDGAGILGYVVGFKADTEFHLADFAVRPNRQRKGIGTALLNCLLTELGGMGLGAVSLEVRASNAGAVRLYTGSGFQTVAIRRGYYSRPKEDALVMVKALTGRLSDWVAAAASPGGQNR